MKKLFQILALFASIVLAGCASQKLPSEIGPNNLPPMSDEANNQIAEAAASVSQSLNDLDAVEQANMAPQAAKRYPDVAKVTLPGVSSVDWNGPIEPLLKQVATSADYRFVVIGASPQPPVIVTIHAEEDSNANIVRSAALQANNRATVKTIPTKKLIELRYLGN